MCWLDASVQPGGLAGIWLIWGDGGAELGELVSVSCHFPPSSKLVVPEFQRATEKAISGT